MKNGEVQDYLTKTQTRLTLASVKEFLKDVAGLNPKKTKILPIRMKKLSVAYFSFTLRD